MGKAVWTNVLYFYNVENPENNNLQQGGLTRRRRPKRAARAT
jgi:hypothetical protein